MSIPARIARNTASLFGSQFLNRALNFIIGIWLVRYLGVTNLGIYYLAVTYVSFFTMAADLGLSTLVVRDVSADKRLADRYLGNFIMLQAILLIALYGLLVIVAAMTGYPPSTRIYIYIYGIGAMLYSASNPYRSIIAAYEGLHLNAMVDVGMNLINALLVMGVILSRGGLLGLVSISLVYSALAYWVYRAFCVRRFARPDYRLDRTLWKYLLKMAVPFALINGFTLLYDKVDVLMLQQMKGSVAVGFYAAAYKLVNLFQMIASSIAASMLPTLTAISQEYPDKLLQGVLATVRLSLAMGAIVVAATFVLAKVVILTLFQAPFLPSVLALQILIWVFIFYLVNSPLTIIFYADKNIYPLTVLPVLLTLFNVAGNLWLIPAYSFYGASLATVATQVLGLALLLFLLRAKPIGREIGKALFRFIFLLLAAFVLVATLHRLAMYFIPVALPAAAVGLGVAAFAYGLIVYYLSIDPEDLVLLQKVFKREMGSTSA